MIKHVEIEYKENHYLRGYLDIPSCFSGKMVIMFHGYTGNKTEHGFLFRDFSRLLSKNKIGSIRMDLSGNGESDGLFREFTFNSALNEIDLIVEFVKKIEGVKEIIFLGFSMGGALACLKCLKWKPNKLILWSGAGNIKEIIQNAYLKSLKDANNDAISSRDFHLSKELFESLNNINPYKDLDQYTNPSLVICGTGDLAVPCKYGVKFFKILPKAKLILMNKTPHGYDNQGDKEKLFAETLNFLVEKCYNYEDKE